MLSIPLVIVAIIMVDYLGCQINDAKKLKHSNINACEDVHQSHASNNAYIYVFGTLMSQGMFLIQEEIVVK